MKPLLAASPAVLLVGVLGVEQAALLFSAVFVSAATYLHESDIVEALPRTGLAFVILYFGFAGFLSPISSTLVLVPAAVENLLLYPSLFVAFLTLSELVIGIGLFSRWRREAEILAAVLMTAVTIDVFLLHAYKDFARDIVITAVAWSLALPDIDVIRSHLKAFYNR